MEGLPRCRCGHTRDHYMVTPEARHTFWGWLLMSVGITSHPIHMKFRCRVCGQVFDETSDPAVMKQYKF